MHSENDKKVAAFTRSRFLKDSAEALREAGIISGRIGTDLRV